MNIQHSSRSDCWYTPVDIIRRVHTVIGLPDLDPASDDFGNSRVHARSFLTVANNGLGAWPTGPASVFLNPPGGRIGNRSCAGLFWERLMAYRTAGQLTEAIFMAFSLEQLQTTQKPGISPIAAFPFCVPARRLRFDQPGGAPGTAPSHSNMIVYVPGLRNSTARFQQVFGDLGAILGVCQ